MYQYPFHETKANSSVSDICICHYDGESPHLHHGRLRATTNTVGRVFSDHIHHIDLAMTSTIECLFILSIRVFTTTAPN